MNLLPTNEVDAINATMARMRSWGLHAVRALRAVSDDLRHPPYARPGHYLSPRTGPEDIARAQRRPDPVGVDLAEADQLALVKKMDLSVPGENRFSQDADNTMFSITDASLLRGMLLHHRPSRVVEIGSGYSTAVALDVADSDLPDLSLICVEPNASRLLGRLRPEDRRRINLIEGLVQEIEPARLVGDVSPGDFFFIDSSHVSKAGSDVNHLILQTLPLLPAGVHVHVHDIQWPFEYPNSWLTERRDWNEAYFLNAFLIGNRDWKIELWGDWLRQVHPDALPAPLRLVESGSIWIKRVS